MDRPLRVGIVAAEPSGDTLGAGLMAALKIAHPHIQFEGIGGDKMRSLGMRSWAPLEALSVMGLVEVLKHLPRLLKLRGELLARWREGPPDVFIGVDAPDFNLKLEQKLRDYGVPTVHYVSPTVWAWRPGRVKRVRRAVDLLLGIFPFEVDFLRRHGVPVTYVGHTLAADMPLEPDQALARADLELSAEAKVLAVLPGSRVGEVSRLAEPFLQAAVWLNERVENLQVVTPLVNENTRQVFDEIRQSVAPNLPVTLLAGQARQAMAASDWVLTASGTATFEALLSKKPMVVGYKLNAFSYWLARLFNLVRVEHVAMANLLADERLAPELIQNDCQGEKLGQALLDWIDSPEKIAAVKQRYHQIHQDLRRETDREAANAVLNLLRARGLDC